MRAAKKIGGVAALLLGAALAAPAYERQLDPRSLRDAYFLGKDSTFRSEKFYQDYVRTYPLPKQGVHVERIEMVTPFKEMVERARRAPDGYNPVQAEADYRRQAPPLAVKVTLDLTPTFPAHTSYTIPVFLGPIAFRDPDFWKEFEFHLVQAGEVTPLAVRNEPFYSCPDLGTCWLAGTVVTLTYDTDQVASRPTRIQVVTPDGQRVEAEFDLSQLR